MNARPTATPPPGLLTLMTGPPEPPPMIDRWGPRLKELRESFNGGEGMTREDLAVKAGLSASYIKLIEANLRLVQKASTLRSLATALGLADISELTGGLAWSVNRAAPLDQRVHPASQSMSALLTRPALAPAGAPPLPLEDLQEAVDSLWAAWHLSPTPYTVMAADLPTLLEAVELAAGAVSGTAPAEEDDRRRAHAVRAQAWALARQFFVATQQHALAYQATERSMASAQASDQPLLVTSAAWSLAGIHSSTGLYEDAEAVSMDAVHLIAGLPESAVTDRVAGMGGALRLFACIAAAHQGDEDGARRHWEHADAITRVLGPAFWCPWTTFSVSNLHPYTVAVEVEMGRPRRAAELATRGNVEGMVSLSRRADYLVDVARAHADRGEDDAALAVLLQAETINPEKVGYAYLARGTAAYLIHRWRVSNRTALREFGQRLGLAA